MKPSAKLILGAFSIVLAAIFFRLMIGDGVVALLEPRGLIASQELRVILKTSGIMLMLAIPLLALFYAIAWKYRADNTKNEYDPERTASVKTELLMWAIPVMFVAVLWGVTWKGAHQLDPYAPIKNGKHRLNIQVVALRWKWLFIYPEQNIATTGVVAFPENTPIHFELTADAPMSSFWIPQLGGQMYAMAGMKTQLNLIAEKGDYAGRNMEINGEGYEGMTFDAKVLSEGDFNAWIRQARLSSASLDPETYAKLTLPSRNEPPFSYATVQPGLFNTIVTKHMPPVKDADKQEYAAPPALNEPEMSMHGM